VKVISKAIIHYEKFLSLWKDADPGIAEVGCGEEAGWVEGSNSPKAPASRF